MAITTRFFSTTGAGAADGTSWNDRAALFSAGNWSTVITGFDFSGSDTLRALIGPGTYTCSQALASGLFSNAPTVANPLILHACDSSGNLLSPSNPDWTSDTAVDWDSTLPVIATTTNISTINLANSFARLIKFTASGATSAAPLAAAAAMDWIVLEHSGSNTGAHGATASVVKLSNAYITMTGSSYRAAVLWSTNSLYNVRGKGVTGSSGNRHGVEFTGSTGPGPLTQCVFYGFGGDGVGTSSATAGHLMILQRCVLANNAGSGVVGNGTASQTNFHKIDRCMITGNGAYGIDAQSAARIIACGNRLRDNTTADFNGFGNYPTDMNYTTDSDDSTEYMDASNGDFRIKNSATIWGQGYGVSDQPASASSGAARIFDGTVVR